MTELTVRNIRFPIDDTVAFQWQPANPSFGLFGNTFTFLAIAFERYIVSATREACRRFTDADVADEADLFVRQEAQHARAHRAHAKAMIERYPGLQETYATANAAYDELLERESTSSTWPTSPTWKPPSRPCSRWCSTTATSSSRAVTSGSARCCFGISWKRSSIALRRCVSITM